MANKIILSSNIPVVAPGDTISFTAQVVNSDGGKPAPGQTVNWTFKPDNVGATLGSISSTTSDAGYAFNTVTADVKAALTITGTLDNGADSPSASLDVGFYSTDLRAPVIPQARNGILDEKSVSDNVQAMIYRHTSDPEVGDIYSFYWGKTWISQIDDGTSGTFPWVINVKSAFNTADVLADGNYTVYYTVTDSNHNVTYSVPFALTVTGGTYVNPIYEAPQFPELEYNTLDWDSLTEYQGAKVKIPYPQENGGEIFAGNTITLYMKVLDKNYKEEVVATKVVATRVVTAEEINSEIFVTVLKEEVTDDKDTFDDVRGQFWYTVTGDGSVGVAGSSFTKTLIIDTVPPHLPSGN